MTMEYAAHDTSHPSSLQPTPVAQASSMPPASSLSILGIGTVSALGNGTESLLAALQGRTHPRVEIQTVQTPRGAVEVPVHTADPEGLDRFIPRRALRRVDRFARMALLASYLAFEEAGLTPPADARTGLVFGTGYGPLQTTFEFQDTMIADGDRGASPTAFAGSVHNAPASQVSIALKLDGPCQTITTFGHTAAGVLRTAEAWLAEGAADLVLAGLGDEFHPLGAYALAMSECAYQPGEMFTALLLAPFGVRASARPPSRYGTISAIQTFDHDVRDRPCPSVSDLIARHDAAILGVAQASSLQGKQARCLRDGLPDRRCAVYTPYYGASPTSFGMDLAAAALSLREGVLYPSPESGGEPHPLAADATLACVDGNTACTLGTRTASSATPNRPQEAKPE